MIHRAENRQFYTIVDGRTVKDSNLSMDALGLLVRMLSMSDEWEFSVKDLMARYGVGQSKLLRCLDELKTAGYLEMKQVKNEAGHIASYAWDVYEVSLNVQKPYVENPHVDNPHMEKPHVEKPRYGKPTCGKTTCGKPDTLTNINITNNNITNIKGTNNKDDFEKLLQPLSPKLKETFLEFIKMRKTIKAPMTAKALDLAIKKAEKLGEGDPDKMKAVIEQSIMNSWKGLFALKEPDRTKPAPIKTGNEFLDLLNEWGETE